MALRVEDRRQAFARESQTALEAAELRAAATLVFLELITLQAQLSAHAKQATKLSEELPTTAWLEHGHTLAAGSVSGHTLNAVVHAYALLEGLNVAIRTLGPPTPKMLDDAAEHARTAYRALVDEGYGPLMADSSG